MNHARRLYLSTYNAIDVIDHLIKNTSIFYRSWKYWHSPVNHALSLAVVIAYDVYKECCEGELQEEWKNDNPVDFFTFRETLSLQMLRYNPRSELYPGDEQMRAVTSLPRAKRKSMVTDHVTRSQLERAKRSRTSRLCGDIDKLCHHVSSIASLTKPRKCAWCGVDTYKMCGVCKDSTSKKGIPLHYNQTKGEGQGEMCFYHYHNDGMFGLGRNDGTSLLNQKGKKAEWKKPSKSDIEQNKAHINSLLDS